MFVWCRQVESVLEPAEPYLLAGKYCLAAHLVPLADAAIARASACVAEQDVPKVRRGVHDGGACTADRGSMFRGRFLTPPPALPGLLVKELGVLGGG